MKEYHYGKHGIHGKSKEQSISPITADKTTIIYSFCLFFVYSVFSVVIFFRENLS